MSGGKWPVSPFQIPNNRYNLYCDAYNKINKTYCKRLRYVCSEHYKDEYDLKVSITTVLSKNLLPSYENEKNLNLINFEKVCGCPLNWFKGTSQPFSELFASPDKIFGDEGYCQEKQKNCRDHRNWVQVNLKSIDTKSQFFLQFSRRLSVSSTMNEWICWTNWMNFLIRDAPCNNPSNNEGMCLLC